LRLFRSAFVPLVAVALVGWLPLQLGIAWATPSLDLANDRMTRMMVVAFSDWVFGSYIYAACYLTLYGCAEGRAPKSVLATLGWAYRRALRLWPGMWLTRFMVSFVVGVASFPLLAGFGALQRYAPESAYIISDLDSLYDVDSADLLPLLLLIPLLIPPIFIYLRYMLAEVVVALGRTDGFDALQKSRALTEGFKKRLVVAVLVIGVPVEIVTGIATLVGQALGLYGEAVFAAITMVGYSVSAALFVHFYLLRGGDLRFDSTN
jgi:hypothetical protein